MKLKEYIPILESVYDARFTIRKPSGAIFNTFYGSAIIDFPDYELSEENIDDLNAYSIRHFLDKIDTLKTEKEVKQYAHSFNKIDIILYVIKQFHPYISDENANYIISMAERLNDSKVVLNAAWMEEHFSEIAPELQTKSLLKLVKDLFKKHGVAYNDKDLDRVYKKAERMCNKKGLQFYKDK